MHPLHCLNTHDGWMMCRKSRSDINHISDSSRRGSLERATLPVPTTSERINPLSGLLRAVDRVQIRTHFAHIGNKKIFR